MSDLCPVAVADGNDMNEIQPKTASECFMQALKTKKLCDVVFTFENCDERIEAHQLILRWRSPVFFAMFRGQGANVGKMREVYVTGIAPQRFQDFLEFIYADKFEVNIAGALDLLHLGHKYKVDPLIEKCEDLLKTEIKVEDAVEVFETAKKYQMAELEEKAGDIMAKNLPEISQNDDFLSMKEDTLVCLLERDDLLVDEVDLFKLVVKWGKSQLKESSDPDELKSALARMLPLLRFTQMTPHDFTSEVFPSNLLSAEEMVAIYAYFGSNEVNRPSISALLKFNFKPRKDREEVSLLDETDSLVRFYKESTANVVEQNGQTQLKECLSLCPAYSGPLAGVTLWNYYPSRRVAIVGILVHYPFDPERSGVQTGAVFRLTVKSSAGTISVQSILQEFEKQLSGLTLGQEAEIKVEPPLELANCRNYCITMEDLDSFYKSSSGGYKYAQRTAGSGVPDQRLSMPLQSFSVKLTAIQRNTSLTGFSTSNYTDIHVIQGVRICLL